MSFDLKKSLPKPGARFVPPAPHGSADAYLLAQAALALKANKRMLTVVVANATDAQRLLAEIPWFQRSAEGEDKLRWAEGSDSPIRALHGYGHYHETYRKIDGEWRIQSMKLTRLRLDTEPWEAAG